METLNTMKTKNIQVDLVEQARQMRMMAERLEREARIARGTRQPAGTHVPERGPYWVGDDGSTEELMAAVLKLMRAHPVVFQEILSATGARENRIKGVINRLQREGVRVVNLGNQARAIWFAPSDSLLVRLVRAQRAAKR